MKKWIMILLFACIANSAIFATGITFTFGNTEITGTSPKYFEFDIMVAASAAGTKIGDAQAAINYNTTAFGENIQGNGKVTVTMGQFLIDNGEYTIVQITDNTTSRLVIGITYLKQHDPPQGADLGTDPTQWAHVKIEIQDEGAQAGLSFQQALMDGNCYESDNSTKYDVTAIDTDDSSLPVQISSIIATTSLGEGVTLLWKTESELNSYGFHIWRARDRGGPFLRVTTEVIPSAGNSSSKNEYSYVDVFVKAGQIYWYKVEELSLEGKSEFFGPIRIEGIAALPTEYTLSQNYPNPFNPETTFNYEVPASADVTIEVFSLIGQKIITLEKRFHEAGWYQASWNGLDSYGNPVPSGVYFLSMDAESFRQVRKMTMMR